MYSIEKLEPASEIGIAREIYSIAAMVALVEAVSGLAVIPWDFMEPIALLLVPLAMAIVLAVKLSLLAWFARLLERGSLGAVIFQSVLLPLGIAILVSNIVNADNNPFAGGAKIHTYVFSGANLILAPLVIYANWSVILKIRRGRLRVMSNAPPPAS